MGELSTYYVSACGNFVCSEYDDDSGQWRERHNDYATVLASSEDEACAAYNSGVF
jgi:hypothetical protein